MSDEIILDIFRLFKTSNSDIGTDFCPLLNILKGDYIPNKRTMWCRLLYGKLRICSDKHLLQESIKPNEIEKSKDLLLRVRKGVLFLSIIPLITSEVYWRKSVFLFFYTCLLFVETGESCFGLKLILFPPLKNFGSV